MPAYQVKRNVLINAPAEMVFDTVLNFNTWSTWSPWLISEPNCDVQVTGDGKRIGDQYHWTGNIIGEGIVTHQKIVAPSLIEDELAFIKPFKSIAKVKFDVKSLGSQTELTWTMDAKLPWFLFWLVPMVQTMISMDFRRGLLMIRDFVEGGSIDSDVQVIGTEETESFQMAGIAGECSYDEIGPDLEKTMAKVATAFRTANIQSKSPMIAVYTHFDMKKGRFRYLLGYIVSDLNSQRFPSELTIWKHSAGKAFHVRHRGQYHLLGNAWSVANAHVRHQKCKQKNSGAYEIYQTLPDSAGKGAVTDIYLPVK